MRHATRLGACPSQTPIGRAGLDPSESLRHGRPFGELGSILCGLSRVQGRDPPVFLAGSTGKSLITPSSIRHRNSLGKTTSVLPPQVLPFVVQKPKWGSGAGVAHLLLPVRGAGIPPWHGKPRETHRALQGYGVTSCAGRGENQPFRQQFPHGRSGEKYLDPHGAGPGEQGSSPRVSVAVETLVKPDNAFSIRPGQRRRKGSGRLPAELLASIRHQSPINPAGIRQELETPGCIASRAATGAFPCHHQVSPRRTTAPDSFTCAGRGDTIPAKRDNPVSA